MNNNKKIEVVLISLLCICVVLFLGAASLKNLVNFYVNDEVDYNEWTADLGTKTETDIATNFYKKMQFINLSGAMHNLLGIHEMNGIVKLENGYLTDGGAFCNDVAIEVYADEVAALDAYVKRMGKVFVYVCPPTTVSKYDPNLPKGVTDYSNDNADRLLEALRARGVAVIDIREQMQAEGIDAYTMMYRTDHHWTTEGGFYAYTKIQNYLTQTLGCEVDPQVYTKDCYTIQHFPKWHLGSRGQRTGIYYAGIDDFDLFIPNFETLVQRGSGQGTMPDLVYDYAPLQNKNYASRYTYDYVLDYALYPFINHKSANDKKILMITDSMGKAVNPFMIMSFQEVRTVTAGGVADMTPEYVADYQPDAVVMLYHPMNISENSFAFMLDTFASMQ